jgi:UDPglucose--hexose-1-phosphate uridylyltransferase
MTVEERATSPAQPDAAAGSASELREDPFTGRQVVLAAGRAGRPAAFEPVHEERRGPTGCPFCRGREGQTPPEVWADREEGTRPDTPGWRIRVVPNKYPAFTPGGEGAAAGRHEVVIHGPEHHAALSELPEETRIRVVATWRQRLLALRGEEPVAGRGGAVMIAVNQGRRAGATLEHSHSQVYATAFRPELVQAEVGRLSGEGCAACAEAKSQSGGGARLVAESGGLLTVCPWASAIPLEALVLPVTHAPGPWEPGSDDATLAGAIGDVLARLRAALGFEPPLNLVLHAAPAGVHDFHWHLHVLPRLTTPAGFEFGAGMSINVVDPQRAASQLRAATAATG